MLEDKSTVSIVSWSDQEDSFVIKDQSEFSKHVLPKHFKHNNLASFVRQLNKYDFHKVGQHTSPSPSSSWEIPFSFSFFFPVCIFTD
jgi:hypothetical protein